jgi:hypothetical protein
MKEMKKKSPARKAKSRSQGTTRRREPLPAWAIPLHTKWASWHMVAVVIGVFVVLPLLYKLLS